MNKYKIDKERKTASVRYLIKKKKINYRFVSPETEEVIISVSGKYRKGKKLGVENNAK